MVKYFDINAEGNSIKCKLYCNNAREIDTFVLFGHGFGGHKDNKAAENLAQKLLSKEKGSALMTFNWPCHGDDVKKRLRLTDCDAYITIVLNDIRERYRPNRICANATSFGGYLFLKYIAEHSNPFEKLVLRCPAVPMYEVLTERFMTPENFAAMEKGRAVPVGFDRKINIDAQFLNELKNADITRNDYLDDAENILILHGTKDEIVPIDAVRAFAENNLIEFVPIVNADHRFIDPSLMGAAISKTVDFLRKSFNIIYTKQAKCGIVIKS